MSVIGENLEHFKGEARDEIERLEIEQVDYLASLDDDNVDDVVVIGPAEWFRSFSWVPVWGLAGARFRRQLELEAYRARHGVPIVPMTMMAVNGFHDAEQQFREDAAKRGLIISNLIADGEIHRCDVEGKGGKGDGAYLLHLDGVPAGGFQNHKDGLGWQNWKINGAGGRQWSEAEKAEYKRKIAAQKAYREKKKAEQYAATQARAEAIVSAATEPPADHPYFIKKGIKAPFGVLYSADPIAIWSYEGSRKTEPNVLIVPMRDIDGVLHSVQLIEGDGHKDYLGGGRKAGTFFVVSGDGKLDPTGLNLPCEGLATGASCYEAKNAPAICAFDAGNLGPVIAALRKRHPKIKLLLCGDDDWKTEIPPGSGKLHNTGRIKGEETAKEFGIKAVFPIFDPARERHDKWTDFNDLHQAEGLDAVRRCLKVTSHGQAVEWPSKKRREFAGYGENQSGLFALSKEEEFYPITNFCARITGEAVIDDGVETTRRFEMESYLAGRRSRFTLNAKEFSGLDWTIRKIGAKAVIFPRQGSRDRARAAIQTLSPDFDERRVYAHTGWRKIDGKQVYLHAGGAIGSEGTVPGIETDLSAHGRLALAILPDPPEGDALRQAIRRSLAILDLGPRHITGTIYATIWRSTFGNADLSGFLAGRTGIFKTALAALMQQHWGAGFRDAMPGSWESTDNSLEAMAFAAKDMICVIDDAAPGGSKIDIERMHQKMGRLIRSQANRSGRGRLDSDASQRAVKYPRGIIFCTGEDLPRGESVQARACIVGMQAGDITSTPLYAAQEAGSRGDYALAMSGWLRHLAATPAAWKAFEEERVNLRRPAGEGEHARTPVMVADLIAALRAFIGFAIQSGAVTAAEAGEICEACEKGIHKEASGQAAHARSQNDVVRFLNLISGALATGKAHLANVSDGQSKPPDPESWGWQRGHWREGVFRTDEVVPSGDLIGWTDGKIVWLEPGAAYQLAQKLAGTEGIPLALGKETLWTRLAEADKLARRTTEKIKNPDGKTFREVVRHTHKKSIGGKSRSMLALWANDLRGTD